MTDNAPSTEGLVTATTPPKPSTPHVIVDPAAAIDAGAKLDPAKAKAKAKAERKPKRRGKRRSTRAPAAREAAIAAGKASKMELDKATKALSRRVAASSAEALAAYEAAKLHQVEAFSEMPQNGEFVLRFANGREFVDGAIDVSRDDLSVADGRATYAKPVEFEPDAPRAFVNEAWLVAASGEAMRCEVGVGMTVGGGYRGRLPAGHLLF